jgi:flagellar biosynthesis GTPase FlhF
MAMETFQFIAADAASALAQIHQRLGPDAVVLSVRPLAAHGVARLFPRTQRVEVLAGIPDKRIKYEAPRPRFDLAPNSHLPALRSFSEGGTPSGLWPSIAWLEAMGLLPTHAARLQELLTSIHPTAPVSLEEEWTHVSAALESLWKVAPTLDEGSASRPHVFVGPPGCGKTTVLCKWLTLAVLTEERSARVWRLDGSSANTSEFLSIHGEVLGVPVERFWSTSGVGADLLFIDLPGAEPQDAHALSALRRQLATLPQPRVHLVLNAAYEASTLFAQWNAFSVLEPEDLIFTHLDEETRRVKLWSFVFGTSCPIRFLSAGQKIPGEFVGAAPRLFFPATV